MYFSSYMLLYSEADLNSTFPETVLGNCFVDSSFVWVYAALSLTLASEVRDLIRDLFCAQSSSVSYLFDVSSTEKAYVNLSYFK